MTEHRWFYRTDDDWKAIRERLKLTACPHCKLVGALIQHGFLFGYDDDNPGRKILRGRRLFCSNRHRRKGCGRTVSVWIDHTIRRTCFNARTLWPFLRHVVFEGLAAAIQAIETQLSSRTLQRFWRRFQLAQSRIRTALLGRGPPPQTPRHDVRHPAAAQLIDHLVATFPNADNPIAAYQRATESLFL